MAHRIFRDQHGRAWDVWEVHPTLQERRSARQPAAPGRERRRYQDFRTPVAPQLRQGWLAFECRNERRRLAPIPEGWSQLSDDGVAQLLEGATLSVKPRRLIE